MINEIYNDGDGGRIFKNSASVWSIWINHEQVRTKVLLTPQQLKNYKKIV